MITHCSKCVRRHIALLNWPLDERRFVADIMQNLTIQLYGKLHQWPRQSHLRIHCDG